MLVILILLMILCCWNIVMVFTKRREWLKEKSVFDKIEVFNLGSSHGEFSFNYGDNKNYKNLGYESQTFYYDYKMLENYYDKIEKNSICFLPISYFSFSTKKYWRTIDKYKYLKILKFRLIDKEDKKEAFILRYLPLIYSIIKKRKKIKKRSIKEKTCEERILGHVRICQDKDNTLEDLEVLINKLKEKEIKIILVTTPFMKEYNDYFSEELLEEKFYKKINYIKEKYKLRYLDFSHMYETFNKKEYFNDFDHLSKEGSKVFMKELTKELKKEGINL